VRRRGPPTFRLTLDVPRPLLELLYLRAFWRLSVAEDVPPVSDPPATLLVSEATRADPGAYAAALVAAPPPDGPGVRRRPDGGA